MPTGPTLGTEIEWPSAPSGTDPLATWGEDSTGLYEEMRHEEYSVSYGRVVRDGSVGAEIVSDPLDPDTLAGWYGDVIEDVEDTFRARFAPVGIINGNTAGLHMHLSPLSREQARTLRDWSGQRWLQVFACTSVAAQNGRPDYRVFRGGRYCQLDSPIDGGRYNVVNQRGSEHYEWRLPEPCTPEHFEYLAEFCKRFIRNPEDARAYAMERLDDPEVPLTSALRADAVGLADPEPEAVREPHPETADFYDAVESDGSAPYIKKVRLDGNLYYGFESSNTGPWTYRGVVFDVESVLDATTLEHVYGPERENVRQVLEPNGTNNETEATELLKDVAADKEY